jgi:hypothetical protein
MLRPLLLDLMTSPSPIPFSYSRGLGGGLPCLAPPPPQDPEEPGRFRLNSA